MPSLPNDVKATIGRFAMAFPVPQKSSGESQDAFEDRCRDWSKRCAEQVKHDHPIPATAEWGIKASSPTNPPSKDSLALASAFKTLESWDLLLGVGTGHPELSPDPEYHHIPQQHFISVVARDHVGGGGSNPNPVPPDPGTPPPPPGVDPVLARLDQILTRLDAMERRMDALEFAVERTRANVRAERILTLRTATFGGSGSGKILPL